VPADASVGSAQKIFQLVGFAQSYANPVAELSVDNCETMLGDSPWRDFLQDQLVMVPAAARRLRRIALRVEKPPKDGHLRRWRSHISLVDHEHAMPGELSVISSHLPVVLHYNLITDIELEDDHRSRGNGWTPGGRGLLLDTCPVAQHGKEQFTETHAPNFFSCSRNRAVCPPASSSLAEERTPPLAPPPSCGARFSDARSWFSAARASRLDPPTSSSVAREEALMFATALEERMGAVVRCVPGFRLDIAQPTTVGLGESFVGGFLAALVRRSTASST
jgi:hypothetical protein